MDVIQNNTELCLVLTKRKQNFQSEVSHGSESMNNALELASQGAIVIEVKCRAEIKIVLGHAN